MSNRKTITVEQYENLMDWESIVRAAGLYSAKQDALTVYLIAGAIIRDEVVSARVCALPNPDGAAATLNGAYEIVLHAMTAEERAALKERVVAKITAKGHSVTRTAQTEQTDT
jgi:hypothetical protein